MYPEDLLPYESDALPETHPSRCGAIARLFGLETQAIETARVLELGCASGTNLLGMAASLPEASFVGVDLSSPAIAEAESRARRHNLSNITFHCLDLNELPDSLGSFDYIIAHGLFSWVDRRTQTALLQAASNHLAPNGLLYLSYNVLPGWHLRLAIREIVLMETAALSDPRKKLQHARGVMGALAFMWERQKSPTAQAGVKELELLQSFPDWFLAHDLLGPLNTPEYSSQVIGRARECGLRYVGDSELWKMAPFDQVGEVAALIRQGTEDLGAIEQRLDWARMEKFRRALFCRADANLNHDGAMLRIPQILLASPMKLNPEQGVDIVAIDSQAATRVEAAEQLLRDAINALSRRWPRGYQFSDLAQECGVSQDPSSPRRESILLQGLFRCLLSGQIWPRLWEPTFDTGEEQKPKGSLFARQQSEYQARVVSGLHTAVDLDDSSRSLFQLLDGSRSKEEIFSLWKSKLSGDFSLETVTSEGEVLLQRFAKEGLLLKN